MTRRAPDVRPRGGARGLRGRCGAAQHDRDHGGIDDSKVQDDKRTWGRGLRSHGVVRRGWVHALGAGARSRCATWVEKQGDSCVWVHVWVQ
jgi:hypothetical protein